jgi:hypothetical protein
VAAASVRSPCASTVCSLHQLPRGRGIGPVIGQAQQDVHAWTKPFTTALPAIATSRVCECASTVLPVCPRSHPPATNPLPCPYAPPIRSLHVPLVDPIAAHCPPVSHATTKSSPSGELGHWHPLELLTLVRHDLNLTTVVQKTCQTHLQPPHRRPLSECLGAPLSFRLPVAAPFLRVAAWTTLPGMCALPRGTSRCRPCAVSVASESVTTAPSRAPWARTTVAKSALGALSRPGLAS